MALFDTDILIDNLRGTEGAKETLLRFGYEKNYCSVITSGEILFRMKQGERKQTFALLNSLEEIPVDKEIIRLSRETKDRVKGYQLHLYDCIISATALKFNQVLITRNVKHYPDDRLQIIVPDY